MNRLRAPLCSPVAIAAACALLAAGCLDSIALKECSSDEDCDTGRPRCVEGLCFHQSIDYVLPLCADGVDGRCCDVTAPTFGKDCEAWRVSPGKVISKPVATPSDTFAVVACIEKDDCAMRGFNAEGATEWSWSLPDVTDAALVRAPVVAQDGAVSFTWDERIFTVGDSVPGGNRTVDTGTVLGRIAGCNGGRVYALTEEGLAVVGADGKVWVVDIEPKPTLAADSSLGPVILREADRAVVPLDEKAVAMVSLAKENGGAICSTALDAGKGDVVGIAPDGSKRVWVASSGGWILGLDPTTKGAGGEHPCDFSRNPADLGLGKITGGPVVVSKGLVLVAAEEGIFQVSWDPTVAPTPIPGGPGSASHLGVLQLGGVAAEVEASPRHLAFSVSPYSLPDSQSGSGMQALSYFPDCDRMEWSLPLAGGVFAVACDGSLVGVASPDLADDGSAWPSERGRFDSACVEPE